MRTKPPSAKVDGHRGVDPIGGMHCRVCEADGAGLYRRISGINYFRCAACGSLFAHPDFLARIDAGEIGN
ncbi:MAG TPA: hypothetical protein VFE41_13565 [Acetobacteraceae bacterium]|jgi:hypothetical protein|nr:hypothetical protein [Acetobacteraceae bacterium]